jgi:predicted transcriptional regulator
MSQDARERPRMVDGEETDAMLVRLPKTLSKRLKRQAFDEDRPKVQIIRDAVNDYLVKHGNA